METAIDSSAVEKPRKMETVDSLVDGAVAPLTEPVLDVPPLCPTSLAGDDPPVSPKCPPLEDSDESRRKQGQGFLLNGKKAKPSAVRDFPLGCGRNAPVMTREDLPPAKLSEVPKIPAKREANSRVVAGGEESMPSKLEAKQSALKSKVPKKVDGAVDVAPGKLEGKQTVQKTDAVKRADGEVDATRSKLEGRQAVQKTNIAKKADGEGKATALKLGARQILQKTNIANKGDGEADTTPSKSEARRTVEKTNIAKKGDGEAGATASKLEARQTVERAKIAKKGDGEGDATPSKLEARQAVEKTNIPKKGNEEMDATHSKLEDGQTEHNTNVVKKRDGEGDASPLQLEDGQTEQNLGIDKKQDGEGDATPPKSVVKEALQKTDIDKNRKDKDDVTPSKSEAKRATLKTKIVKTEDGEGDITPLNLEGKQAAQKKRTARRGDLEGDGMPSSLEDELSVPKKKIAKKGNGEEAVTASKSKTKQAVSKARVSKQAAATKMPVLGSEEAGLLDSQTAVEMKNCLKDPGTLESESTPRADEINTPSSTEPSSKKRKKTPANRPSRSVKKQSVFRAGEGGDDALASSDRKAVKRVLMIFDALRRKFMQEDEASKQTGGGGSGGVKRPDLKAGTMMMEKGLWLNRDRRIIGSVPGVQPGDHFYFRMELCVLGLHGQVQAGIDYIGAKHSQWNDPVAISIIASGGYEDNEDDGGETLVYTGQGGNNYKMDKRQSDDQKLERGNLALERSQHHGVEVRVIRGIKDNGSPSGKIYTYDGLYKVEESWLDKGRSGFGVFKYRLQRLPGQPEMGSEILKSAVKWKSQPSLREGLILPDISSKRENFPVYLVNSVDDDKEPPEFEYISKVRYSKSIGKLEPWQGCDCKGNCLAGDKCSCFSLNGGEMPYNQNGLLVRGKPLVYECGEHCRCPPNCRNRVSQRGLKYHLEVFKTDDRGWGVRSWDPISAGSFISEYVGEVVPEEEVEQQGEENEYVLYSKRIQENWTEWGNISDILPEKAQGVPSQALPPLTFAINSSNMGNISRFINHSCSPNVFVQFVLHDHNDARFPHIMLFAMENIPALTEITLDYGCVEEREESGANNSFKKSKDCLCGSPDCRGKFY